MSDKDEPKILETFSMPLDSHAQLMAKGAKDMPGRGPSLTLRWDNCDIAERNLIHRISTRGVEMGKGFGVAIDFHQATMDVMATHCNCVRLKLLQFAMSDMSDFANDFSLIGRFIDRRTGQLPSEIVGKLRFADPERGLDS